jgi:hypothetical protein
MLTVEKLEAQLALCDKLAEKPAPAPRVSRPVDQEDARLHPENYILVAGRSLAHRCKGHSRQAKRRCKRPASKSRDWCKFHGGNNRGPTTPEGLAKCAEVNVVHGDDTRQNRRDRKAAYARMRVLGRAADELLKYERGMRRLADKSRL